MKRFLTTVGGVFFLGGMMSLVLATEAFVQDNFWNEAAQLNMAEIMAGNMALERSQNEQVKQFAQQMVTDHTATATEMQTLAASKNATLPTAVTDGQKSDIDKLGAKTGNDFDRDFMRMMVRGHERMARLLERESERNSDADVKAFAAKNLPVVQSHLTMARTLNDSLRGNNNRGNNSGNMNMNSNSGNTNRNDANMGNTGNTNDGDTNQYSNRRPNVNRNANTNANMDDMNMNGNTNGNRNRNRNTNRNTNTNRPANNSNTNGNANNSNVNGN